ncbi:MAG: Na/Pi cotransporter family protein, partial [Muribaculaceae bacterium]|nr:Na/Pi cotransporter family protein [Muribaculaceae bacterium]
MSILQLFTLLGALGMFLYGMNLMSSGLQKVAGDSLRGFLSAMTSNPFKGVMTGLGITTIIQSSSATTVMVVSFVNAGLLTLTQAVGVIMGANIGTTVTAWMVSWLGFKADISVLAVPLMLLGFLFSNSKKDKRKNIGELIVGFSLLFLGLSFMKESVPDLRQTPEVLEFVTSWASHGYGSVLLFLALGTILTLVLQSSSATMAITLIMLSMGWIPFEMACAMVLGENIGTTITANIAASVGNTQAKRTALSHTIFNLFGVIWALLLFKPFLSLVGFIIEKIFNLPNPAVEGFSVSESLSPEGTAAL